MWSFFCRLSALMAKFYKAQANVQRQPVYFTYNGQLYMTDQGNRLGHRRGVYSFRRDMRLFSQAQQAFNDEMHRSYSAHITAVNEAQRTTLGDEATKLQAGRDALRVALGMPLQPGMSVQDTIGTVIRLRARVRGNDVTLQHCPAYLRNESYKLYRAHTYFTGVQSGQPGPAQNASEVPYDLFDFDYRRTDVENQAAEGDRRNLYDQTSCKNYMPQAECVKYDKTKFCEAEAKLTAFFGTPAVKDQHGEVATRFIRPDGRYQLRNDCTNDADTARAPVAAALNVLRTQERNRTKRKSYPQPRDPYITAVNFGAPDRTQTTYGPTYTNRRTRTLASAIVAPGAAAPIGVPVAAAAAAIGAQGAAAAPIVAPVAAAANGVAGGPAAFGGGRLAAHKRRSRATSRNPARAGTAPETAAHGAHARHEDRMNCVEGGARAHHRTSKASAAKRDAKGRSRVHGGSVGSRARTPRRQRSGGGGRGVSSSRARVTQRRRSGGIGGIGGGGNGGSRARSPQRRRSGSSVYAHGVLRGDLRGDLHGDLHGVVHGDLHSYARGVASLAAQDRKRRSTKPRARSPDRRLRAGQGKKAVGAPREFRRTRSSHQHSPQRNWRQVR